MSDDEKRSPHDEKTLHDVDIHTRDVLGADDAGVVDPVYHAKARIVNDALQEIGMGKYQVRSYIPLESSSDVPR
jgi:hypothetical protein